MGRPRYAAALLFVAAAAHTTYAQTPRTISLRIDNDAFNFWTTPWNRPDGEYTSGVHITYDGGAAPRWSRGIWPAATACVVGARECQTSRAELGQDIYTPSLSASSPIPRPDERPNAGWLYLSQSARVLKPSRADELTVTLGVTGPPSLARFTQRLAHAAAPHFNRPTDWTRQIGFEPGAMVRYEQRRRIGPSAGYFDLIPEIAATLGNVNISSEAGLLVRTGLNLHHPWLPESGGAELVILGGVSGRVVARDLFLDGNTFREGDRVGHDPFVKTAQVGAELRIRALTLGYRTVTTSRAYDGGPQWHPWSSMTAGITFDR